MTCTHCKDTKAEPTADGIPCNVCCGNPSWSRMSPSRRASSNTSEVANASVDAASDFFLWNAIGDLAECAGEIVGAAFD